MKIVIEHQYPYGTVILRTTHTSPERALRRYRECLRKKGSAVFIICDGIELTASDVEALIYS